MERESNPALREPRPKDFLDMIAPAAVKFNTDYYILGGAYHCAMTVQGYPTTTEELAILGSLGERSGVALTIYARRVTAAEEQKIIQNAANRSRFLMFGVKGLLRASGNVKNAMLFNVLSYLSDKLLTEGTTVASIDELYLFLSNPTTIEYIRNFMKRVRKKDSAVLLASQNIEDSALPGIAELTKPLFSIPTHQFLFNAGSIDRRFFMDNLQLEESEYELIRFPQRGVCLYKCGNERYLLEVIVPEYKKALCSLFQESDMPCGCYDG